MKESLISDILLDGSQGRHLISHCRCSIFGGLGYSEKDLAKKPKIGIVNSFTDINPGHVHLDKLASVAKEGIIEAGGIPFEFNTPAPCDATSCGLDTMKYVLPQRDLIADSVEMMVKCNSFDGLVFLSSCDKIVPAHLMAAARINIPSIFIPGGAALPSYFFATKEAMENQAIDRYIETGDDNLKEEIFNYSSGGTGACSGTGTANTMQTMVECLGMALPGCASTLALDPSKHRYARESGRRIVEMVHEKLYPSKVMTEKAFENAIAVHTAFGGSTNAVIHLIAIAHELGIVLKVSDFERIGKGIPCVIGLYPASNESQLDLHRAGGIPALEKRIEKFLNRDALNVSGATLGEIIDNAVIHDETIIRPLDKPFFKDGGLAILHGNLAPETAVIKSSAVKADMLFHRGPAKVFNSEDEARIGIHEGRINHGDVIVIRYEGPKGGPGMREMLMITKYLAFSGKADDVALVTDGRFSGFTSGPAVGHVCPEAADGGPIALVEDGDMITIDVPNRALILEVPDSILSERKKNWKPVQHEATGYLLRYAKNVRPVSEGAVIT